MGLYALAELIVGAELGEVGTVVLGFGNKFAESFAQDLLFITEGVNVGDDTILYLVRVAAVGHLVNVIDVLGFDDGRTVIRCCFHLLGALVGEEAPCVAVRESLQALLVRFGKSFCVHVVFGVKRVNIFFFRPDKPADALSAGNAELLAQHLFFLLVGIDGAFVVVATPVFGYHHVTQWDVVCLEVFHNLCRTGGIYNKP